MLKCPANLVPARPGGFFTRFESVLKTCGFHTPPRPMCGIVEIRVLIQQKKLKTFYMRLLPFSTVPCGLAISALPN